MEKQETGVGDPGAGNSARRGAAGPGEGIRILVVDDDPISRNIVRDQLGARGYIVESCGDARSALSMVRHQEYDLLLLDIFLPHRDGRSLHTSVMAVSPALARRTIFMSHWEPAGVLAEYIGSHGVFLKKPFSVEGLLRGIQLAESATPA